MVEINSTDSLLEIAYNELKKKKNPKSMNEIIKDVFQIKGIDIAKQKNKDELIAQFEVDFMLSGFFVCCGERKGTKLWDIKTRQHSNFVNKDDGAYDDYLIDDDTIDEELVEDALSLDFTNTDDDDEDDEVEHDEIAEEMLDVAKDDDVESRITTIDVEDEDEEDEDSESDEELFE